MFRNKYCSLITCTWVTENIVNEIRGLKAATRDYAGLTLLAATSATRLDGSRSWDWGPRLSSMQIGGVFFPCSVVMNGSQRGWGDGRGAERKGGREGERVLIKSCNCFKPFTLLVSHPISTLQLEEKVRYKHKKRVLRFPDWQYNDREIRCKSVKRSGFLESPYRLLLALSMLLRTPFIQYS
jgi:hypothetical protein